MTQAWIINARRGVFAWLGFCIHELHGRKPCDSTLILTRIHEHKKTAFALMMALGLVAAQKASATTETYTLKGNSCISITSGIIGQYGIYGVSPNSTTAMDVICPIVLPDRNYSRFGINIQAYSRSTPDKVSCTISTTDYGGSNLTTATATVSSNTGPSQNAFTSISPSIYSNELALTCHIPGNTTDGPSYLTYLTLDVLY